MATDTVLFSIDLCKVTVVKNFILLIIIIIIIIIVLWFKFVLFFYVLVM
jgi:hypothetical protein